MENVPSLLVKCKMNKKKRRNFLVNTDGETIFVYNKITREITVCCHVNSRLL